MTRRPHREGELSVAQADPTVTRLKKDIELSKYYFFRPTCLWLEEIFIAIGTTAFEPSLSKTIIH